VQDEPVKSSDETPEASSPPQPEQNEATPSGPTPPAQNTGDSDEDQGGAEREEFAKLVEATGDPTPEVKVGDRLRGKIVSIDEEHAFVDYSGRAEARIAVSELRDKNQKVVMRVGDSLSATVSAVDDGVVLTLGRRRGVVHAARLREAFENKVPVQGTVKASNKGGFDVQIGGIRTFCPLSQIERTYVEDPQSYLGKSFTFRVLRWENGGRNIVVTRRALLEEEAAEKAVETRKRLAVDAVLDGTVTRIQPFGAFIDIGGLEGLLHVSRMAYGRVDDPHKVVDIGQKVSVRVLSIEHEGTRKERISLGLADLGPDPWETLLSEHKEGDVVTGKVARLTDFGAFVQLAEGVDGLVHISEISNQRIQHPQEVLQVGQEVEVRILRLETDKRRVSLSIRQVSEEQPARPRREPRAARRQESMPSNSGSLTHTMADQLGALKKKLRDQ
jgi:small subunit ribosomal protein S1